MYLFAKILLHEMQIFTDFWADMFREVSRSFAKFIKFRIPQTEKKVSSSPVVFSYLPYMLFRPSDKPVRGLNTSSNSKEPNCFPIFWKWLYQQKLCRRYWCSTCTNCHFVWCHMSVGFCVEKKLFWSFTTLFTFIWKSQVWLHKKIKSTQNIITWTAEQFSPFLIYHLHKRQIKLPFNLTDRLKRSKTCTDDFLVQTVQNCSGVGVCGALWGWWSY